MDEQSIRDLLSGLEDTVFIVKPKYDQTTGEAGEAKFLFSVIKRAIDDLSYLLDERSTKEQFNFGRSAFVWLFVERLQSIERLYGLSESRNKKIRVTTFDNICSWLDIDPDFLRRYIASNSSLPFTSIFLDN